MRYLQTQRKKNKTNENTIQLITSEKIRNNWQKESAEGNSHQFLISLGMTEIQMDVTARKGKFSSGLKDSPTHTSIRKLPGKEFLPASY